MASERAVRLRAPPFIDPPGYVRHRPEATLLYQLIERHYPELVAAREAAGRPLPKHVQEEFEAYLRCGRFEHGFLPVRCAGYHAEKLVAFDSGATMKASIHSSIIVAFGVALAQSAVAADDRWEHTVAIYAIAAAIDGDAGVGNVTADVDVSFGDILDNLDGAAMLAYRAERGPWAVYADLNWMNLKADKGGLGPAGGTRAEAEVDQLIGEVGGGYALNEQLDVYGGLRYWDVDAEVTVATGGPLGSTLSGSISEDWIDPLVGLRYTWPLSEAWHLVAKGDIGGFGVGSDFSWCITAAAGWALSEHATLMFGLRYIGVDYEDGSGANRFLMDLTEGGPAAAFAWRF